MKIPEIQLIYLAGSYGNYILWCMYSFTSLNTSGTIDISESSNGFDYVRRLPKNIVIKPSHYVFSDIHNMVAIMPDRHRRIEYMNNVIVKDGDNNHRFVLNDSFPPKDLPIWEQRELFSYWLRDNLFVDSTIDHFESMIGKFEGAKVLSNGNDFLKDPVTELTKISKPFGLTVILEDELIKCTNDFVAKQPFLDHHIFLDNYLSDLLSGVSRKDTLTFFDAAWTQAELLKRGYELRCFDLDIWPENTDDVRKLLIKEGV